MEGFAATAVAASLLAIVVTACVVAFAWCGYRGSLYAKITRKPFREVAKDKGAYGEYLIGRRLERAFPEGRLLFNVYVPKVGGGTSEIDVLMVTARGLYAFESKNYSGWVFGREADSHWTVTFPTGVRHRFYNPVLQNASHVRALSAYLGVSESAVRSVIVFGDRATLKKLSLSGGVPVVKAKGMVEAVRRMEASSGVLMTDEAQRNVCNGLLRHCCYVSEEAKAAHVDRIKDRFA